MYSFHKQTTFREISLFWSPDVQEESSLQMEPISCPETSATNPRDGTTQQSAISGFGREVDEDCLLLGCYTASGGNSLPKLGGGVGPTGCIETSVMDYHYLLRTQPRRTQLSSQQSLTTSRLKTETSQPCDIPS
jgi:hypothetical protein